MKNLGSFSLSLPFGMINELASFPEISFISLNAVVHTSGHVSETTGAAAGQAAATAAGRGTINGSGVAIAHRSRYPATTPPASHFDFLIRRNAVKYSRDRDDLTLPCNVEISCGEY
jgi:hypothetical protein